MASKDAAQWSVAASAAGVAVIAISGAAYLFGSAHASSNNKGRRGSAQIASQSAAPAEVAAQLPEAEDGLTPEKSVLNVLRDACAATGAQAAALFLQGKQPLQSTFRALSQNQLCRPQNSGIWFCGIQGSASGWNSV